MSQTRLWEDISLYLNSTHDLYLTEAVVPGKPPALTMQMQMW